MLRPTTFAILLGAFLWSSALAQKEPTPAWAAEAIFYQLFPERFRNGDPKNDPTRDSLETPPAAGTDWKISPWTADWYARDEWEKNLGDDFYRHGVFERRYGGDLQGVIDKLDYLAELGVNTIYFNPVFYARSLHKYDGSSYHHIDPYFGPDPKGDFALMAKETSDPKTWQWTAADKLFLELVKKCHARGMRVILDGVFNHTGRDFFAFQNLRTQQQNSPYKDWYVVSSFDDPKTKRNEFSYKGWWGHASLPVFAATKDNQDVAAGPKAYIFEATRRWMRPNGKMEDGIDGWRLDVADERPAKFWADWNRLVRQLNPQAYTSAEIWKNAVELVTKGEFSACMNYNAFAIPVKGFLIDDKVAPSKFAKILDERRRQFPPGVSAVMQNLMDSHDTDRLASMIVNRDLANYSGEDQIEYNNNNDARASKSYSIRKPSETDRALQRMIVLFQMTYVGAPMIYYGDEAGMWGGHDPDERMPMVWPDMTYDPQVIDPRGTAHEPDKVEFDQELFDFYKRAIALRKSSDALNHGEYAVLSTDDLQRSMVFTRRTPKQSLVVALNRGGQPATIPLHVAAKKLKAVFATSKEAEAMEPKETTDGAELTLPPLTGVVFSYN